MILHDHFGFFNLHLITPTFLSKSFLDILSVSLSLAQYPVSGVGFKFIQALVGLFYGDGIRRKVNAGWTLLHCLTTPAKVIEQPPKEKAFRKSI
jgi:hypothetical protein